MPRLAGKREDNSWMIGLVLIAGVAAVGTLEYMGATNFIPEFGRESGRVEQTDSQRSSSTSLSDDVSD
ncbi:MAG: hypothetical protein KME20_06735 [Kaiparowitsia implicata GSE-PSE-MK54-09C]|nr:hypothetical protein [Kaiparowitsia implicata GSE-PSE-MK54-09C]